jgi:SAM-dependent methyltransferase
MIERLKNFYREAQARNARAQRAQKIAEYQNNGHEPWSSGYWEYRNDLIKAAINDGQENFVDWAQKLDERVVELPWAVSQLSKEQTRLLDAGSSLNHDFLLDHIKIKSKDLTICTFHPENYSRLSQRISYVFADLRDLPFKDNWFDEVVSISTIEHIDMDNSMYGYEQVSSVSSHEKSYEYLTAMAELVRVLKSTGCLLVSFPFGRFENHSFFQQFDQEMVSRIEDYLMPKGKLTIQYFLYSTSGWNEASSEACQNAESHNPHTGVGKKGDGAAHSRAIVCLKFIKS